MTEKLPPLRRRYSQNFLQNKIYARQIVEALRITRNDVILEIGPGSGVLTQYLYPIRKQSLIVCEIDPEWIAHLQSIFPDDITILKENILNISFEQLSKESGTKLKVIGNIPYHITSPILFSLFEQSPYISEAVLMVQKEIADRLIAAPRTKAYGILTVLLGSKTEIKRLFNVSRKNFFPRPTVDSSVIRLTFNNKIEGLNDEDLFKKIVRHTFNTRRKMLQNSLKKFLKSDILQELTCVPLTSRPEELSIDAFKQLANEIAERMV